MHWYYVIVVVVVDFFSVVLVLLLTSVLIIMIALIKLLQWLTCNVLNVFVHHLLSCLVAMVTLKFYYPLMYMSGHAMKPILLLCWQNWLPQHQLVGLVRAITDSLGGLQSPADRGSYDSWVVLVCSGAFHPAIHTHGRARSRPATIPQTVSLLTSTKKCTQLWSEL